MNNFLKAIFIYLIFSIFLSGCGKNDKEYIDLDNPSKSAAKDDKKFINGKTLTLALGSMTTPKQAYGYYNELVEYIENKLRIDIKIIDNSNYSEINNLLMNESVDIAFVCGGTYVDGHDKFGLELLVAPLVQGKIKHYSYIIVNKNSKISKLEDFKQKTFAFTDLLSNSGRMAIIYMLNKELNETPNSFFKEYIFSGSHDDSIAMVASGIVDGASVDSLIWEYLNNYNPKDTPMTKIIKISSPYGIPPVVIKPHFDNELKQKIKQIFLNMHEDSEAQKILRKMMIEKFIAAEDSNYDDIREINKWIQERNLR
ncbi:phosphate/phosphite/phosphonate ABC transporter substrate-binding protein [Candidatus Poribacteria bacterium]|nr:phosphate/phosphite/phosphonate ABC transporter substrate-binding protein [Candidatus Poribacteria bacterium]